MSDFDDLQFTLHRISEQRRTEQELCEGLLNGLYRALRTAGGRGQPLNNVSMDIVPDPWRRLVPVPLGEFHAAWFRLGLCEVLVRLRLHGEEFHGEFGNNGVFRVTDLDDDSMDALARQVLREVTSMYQGVQPEDLQLN